MDNLLKIIFGNDITTIIKDYLKPLFLFIDDITIDTIYITNNIYFKIKYDYYDVNMLHNIFILNYNIENTKVNKRKIQTFSRNLNLDKRCFLEIYKKLRSIIHITYVPSGIRHIKRRYYSKNMDLQFLTKSDYDNICYQFNKLAEKLG